MGKSIRVAKGKEVLEIDAQDLPFAAKDGYLPTEKIIVANAKTKESFEIEPSDYLNALNDGYSFLDIAKKKEPQYSSVSPTAAKPSIPTFGAIKVSTTPATQVLKEQPKVPTPSSTPLSDFADLEKLYQQRQNAKSKITSADQYTVANELPQSMLDQMNEPYIQEVSKLDKIIAAKRKSIAPVIANQAADIEKNWQSWTKDGVPDYEKIYNYAGQLSKKYGGGANVKEEVANALIDAAKSGRIKVEADKKFKEKLGVTVDQFIADKQRKGGVTPEDIITIENTYKASVNDVVKAEAQTKEALAESLPLMQRIGASFLSSLKGGIASQGAGIAAMGVNNAFTDYLRGFKTGSEQMSLPEKEWSIENITSDPLGTVLPFVAGQAGVSLPGMATAIGVGLATGGPLAGALVSSLSEKAANVGDTYTQLIEQGVPVNIAKERAANLMRPMVTDIGNVIDMNVLLKAVKGKGNVFVNALIEGGTESGQEVQQQFEQAKAINPDLSFEQFKEENDLPDLIAKTFVSSSAMGGGVSLAGKVFNVLATKVPNSVTQKIQNVVQQQGALAAKDAIDAQTQDGTLTSEEAETLKSQVDEVEAADKSLEQLGLKPEVRLAAGALSTRITDLEKQIQQEKNPAVLSKLNQEKKAAQAEMDAIVSGEKGFVVITPEGGTPYAVPEAAAKEVVADLSDEIKNGEVKAEKVGNVEVEIPKAKPARRIPKISKEQLPDIPQVEEEAAIDVSESVDLADKRMVDAIVYRVSVKGLTFDKAVEDAIKKNRESYDPKRKDDVVGEARNQLKQLGVFDDDLEKEISNYKLDTQSGLIKYKNRLSNSKASLAQFEKEPQRFKDEISLTNQTIKHQERVLKYLSQKNAAAPEVAAQPQVETTPTTSKTETVAPEAAAFTQPEIINRDYKALKEKIGEKGAKKYFEQVDRLIDPNKNEVVEYRSNGVVVKEGGDYVFKPLMDMDLKNWRLSGIQTNVNEQFAQPAAAPATAVSEPIQPITAEPAPKAKEGVTEEVSGSVAEDSGRRTEGRTAVPINLTKDGGNLATNDNGMPIRLFHGTQRKFENFVNPSAYGKVRFSTEGGFEMSLGGVSAIYFTTNKDVAKTYSELKKGKKSYIKEVFLEIKNPYVIDANGKTWTGRIADEYKLGIRAIKNGFLAPNGKPYDSVWIKNVIDNANNERNIGDVYAVIDTNKIYDATKYDTVALKEKKAPTNQPKDGDRVTVISKTDKKGIEYFYKDGAWRFMDSRGKEQKTTAKEGESVTEEWRAAQGQRKTLADTIRKAKVKTDKAFDATLGLPVAVWNGAVEVVARAVEGGVAAVEAVKRGINYIQKNHRGRWNKQAYNDRIVAELGLRGITINGEDLYVKDTKEFAETINGFYSDIEQALLDSKKQSQPAKDWIAELGNSDEAKWTGLRAWLEEQKGGVSKADIRQYLKDNRIEILEVVKGEDLLKEKVKPIQQELQSVNDKIKEYRDRLSDLTQAEKTELAMLSVRRQELSDKLDSAQSETVETGLRYTQYQLPGEKENYKEVLVTLPSKDINVRIRELENKAQDSGLTQSERAEFNRLLEQVKNVPKDQYGIPKFKPEFSSTHFDEKNILVHLRMNTRTAADGSKVLFLEEVQSDAAQGKRKGTVSWEAPFITETPSWVRLGLKVALKEAVAHGADKIAWTTGEQQNDRYDLSKTVDVLNVRKNRVNGKYEVFGYKNGQQLVNESVDESNLQNVLGKEIAEKAINGQTKFEGKDLQVGGKGMKGFYGSPTEGSLGIVGNVAKSLFKQEPKTINLETAKNNEYTLGEANYVDGVGVYDGKGDMVAEFDTKAEANRFIAEKSSSTQQSIDITPELKTEAESGVPLFGDIKGRGKEIADWIRTLRPPSDFAQSNILGLPLAIYDSAIVTIANAVEAGATVAQAIADAVAEIKKQFPNWNKEKEFTEQVTRASNFTQWLKDVLAAAPDATVEEIMDAIAEDVPDYVDTPQKRQAIQQKVSEFLKTKGGQNAIQERKPTAVSMGEAPEDSGEMGEGDAEREATQEGRTKGDEKEGVRPEIDGSKLLSIKHADTAQAAEELGLMPYEKTRKSDEELFAAADAMLRKGVDINEILDRMKNGQVSDVETIVIARYAASLRKQIEENPTNENINEYDRVRNITDVSGSEQARAFRARKMIAAPEPTLADFFVRQKAESQVDELTDEQIAVNKKEYEELKKAEKDWQEWYQAKVQEATEQLAKQNLTAIKPQKGRVKTDEEFKQEIKSIKNRIKEKLAKINEGKTIIIDGQEVKIKEGDVSVFAKKMIAITPEIMEMAKAYIEKGVTELADIVKRIHSDIKDDMPDVAEQDVLAAIAGEYKQPKQTRNEKAAKLYELRQEAKILAKIAELERGETPKTPEKRVEKNQKLKALRDKLKEMPEYQAEQQLKRIKSQITKLEEDLKTGNFLKEKPKPIVTLTEEGRKLKDKLVELKTQREIRLLTERYNNRSTKEKVFDSLVKAANVPRTLMASADFSAPLRQAAVATTAYPSIAKEAAKLMFKVAKDKKAFDEWFYDLENSENYDLIREFELGVADPKSPYLAAREEAFMSGYVENAEKALSKKLFGRDDIGLVQGSERAYVMYLNKMRVDIFNKLVSELQANGKTPENSPESYKAAAMYVNNITGRGGLGKFENATPYLSAMFFSPKLMASRLALLFKYPVVLYKLPKEVRRAYLKDMGKFMGTGATIIGGALLAGALMGGDDDKVEVEYDPRSSDFGKIKIGKARWDIWGGFQQYVRFIAQFTSGQRKNITSGELIELDGEGPFGEDRGAVIGRFGRAKLAPVPSAIINLTTGRNVVGERVDLRTEIINNMLPLIATSTYEAYKEGGVGLAAGTAIPSIFGIGTEVHGDRYKEVSKSMTIDGQTVKLTDEQHAKIEKDANDTIKAGLEKVRAMPEYKAADKKMRADMETEVKRISFALVKKKFINENLEQLQKQAEAKDEKKEKTKELIKSRFGETDDRRRQSRKRER